MCFPVNMQNFKNSFSYKTLHVSASIWGKGKS